MFLRYAPLSFEQLEDRLTPATTATFFFGVLAVTGDAAANNIVVSANSDGTLRVTDNGAAVAIRSFGGTPTLARTAAVSIAGLGGDDTLTADASLGDVSAVLSGGAGNDSLNGGGGRDVLLGGAGNDSLNGGGNRDLLYGGLGDDKLDGGELDGSADVLIGGPGADVFTRTAGENDLFLDVNADEGDTILDV
jgi:Ca2+-binding RTX toxin-like protein